MDAFQRHRLRQIVAGRAIDDFKTLQEIAEANVFGSMIDDEAHGAFIRVGAQVNDGARETAIGHAGHGNEKLPFERFDRCRSFVAFLFRHVCSDIVTRSLFEAGLECQRYDQPTVAPRIELKRRPVNPVACIVTGEADIGDAKNQSFTSTQGKMMVRAHDLNRIGVLASAQMAAEQGPARSCAGLGGVLVAAMIAAMVAGCGQVLAASEGWHQGYKHKTRLVAGHLDVEGKVPQLAAFIDVAMDKGWKTYWRHPGEAGGIPPQFTWDGSDNLSEAKVLFPAPTRLTDEAGDTVGYKERVTFPVLLTREDDGQPLRLKLRMNFGICEQICVPAEAVHAVTIEPGSAAALPAAFSAILQDVPRSSDAGLETDPKFLSVAKQGETGDRSTYALTVRFANNATGQDVFLEAPPGLFIPVPKFERELDNGRRVYKFDLTETELEDLKGKALAATMVSDQGSSEAAFQLP